jgi:hypothetical protein
MHFATTGLLVAYTSALRNSTKKRARFSTIPCKAILERPPTYLPPIDKKRTGSNCFKVRHPVLANDSNGKLSMPFPIGELSVYVTEMAMIDSRVERACAIMRANERGRGNRDLTLGERTLFLVGGERAKDCMGAYFEMRGGETKKLF